MIIQSKLTEKDYVKAIFALRYSQKTTFIRIGLLIVCAMMYLGIYILSPATEPFPWQVLFYFNIAFVVMLVLPYFLSKKSFRTNKMLGETTKYEFTQDYLIIKGGSFSTQVGWGNILKVKQIKNWVFIWQSIQVFNVISKTDIWEEQISELKAILNKHKVKNNL
ncbi:hypothetical protein [Parasediminibacterium sp. JCM 36343]|uniref:hypothetical protein n=1 Tax=Parasediminibacterium sp. JCM 36343 TaxID=3374279 RepID=UPI00397E29ED